MKSLYREEQEFKARSRVELERTEQRWGTCLFFMLTSLKCRDSVHGLSALRE